LNKSEDGNTDKPCSRTYEGGLVDISEIRNSSTLA
jgi:hypothetical protein